MIESAIYTKLASISAITDIVSTRIYPGYAPHSAVRPYLTFTPYTSSVNEVMTSNVDIEDCSFSFVVVSADYDQARTTIKLVKDELERWEQASPIAILHTAILRYTPIIYNADLEAYHRGVDIKFDYRPSTI